MAASVRRHTARHVTSRLDAQVFGRRIAPARTSSSATLRTHPPVHVVCCSGAVATDRLLGTLGGVDAVEAFGKAAVVGTAGEIEHAGALIHTPYFGNLVREYLQGETLVVPLWHKTHAATRSHYQTIGARVPDAPRADELVVIAAASTGPRPHSRIGDRRTDPTDATIRSHHQTIEIRIPDAPHPNEIVIALAASAQGRPQQRLAPLSTEQ